MADVEIAWHGDDTYSGHDLEKGTVVEIEPGQSALVSESKAEQMLRDFPDAAARAGEKPAEKGKGPGAKQIIAALSDMPDEELDGYLADQRKGVREAAQAEFASRLHELDEDGLEALSDDERDIVKQLVEAEFERREAA
jgi:hypothetical protein